MKSKQLFDDFDEETIDKKDVKKKASDESKKKNNSSNQKESKVKKKVKRNDSSNNNSTSIKSSKNRSSIIDSSSNNRSTDKSKTNKESSKSTKRICRSNENIECKSSEIKKTSTTRSSNKSKKDEINDRRTKDKGRRSGKQIETASTECSSSSKETKKRSELIEDYKKWNAPDEYLIGKINPYTKRPYIQMGCNKRGWTYIDVTDLNWLKEHIGYDGKEIIETKYSKIDSKK